jgi:chaperone BCS1
VPFSDVSSYRCILLLEDLDAAFACGITSTGDPKAPTKATAEGNGGSALSLSGLLASLDRIDFGEGWCVSLPIAAFVSSIVPVIFDRLIFATINHVERLDPALSRPGRMDVWINFTHATKWQAEWIFKRFFQSRPSPNGAPSIDAPREPRPGRRASAHGMPTLEEAEIVQLAQRFADAIPEGEISVRSVLFDHSGACAHARGFAGR